VYDYFHIIRFLKYRICYTDSSLIFYTYLYFWLIAVKRQGHWLNVGRGSKGLKISLNRFGNRRVHW